MVTIDISRIRDVLGGVQPISLSIGLRELGEADSWVHGEIVLLGQVVNVGKTLRLNCEVASRAKLECSRCLTLFEEPVKFALAAELELEANQGDVVDISPYIREELIFQEPMKPLCRQDCRGICPYCGKDLNQSECKCDQTAVDPRLAGLKRLLEP